MTPRPVPANRQRSLTPSSARHPEIPAEHQTTRFQSGGLSLVRTTLAAISVRLVGSHARTVSARASAPARPSPPGWFQHVPLVVVGDDQHLEGAVGPVRSGDPVGVEYLHPSRLLAPGMWLSLLAAGTPARWRDRRRRARPRRPARGRGPRARSGGSRSGETSRRRSWSAARPAGAAGRGQGGAAGADPLAQRDLLCCATMSVDFRQFLKAHAGGCWASLTGGLGFA